MPIPTNMGPHQAVDSWSRATKIQSSNDEDTWLV